MSELSKTKMAVEEGAQDLDPVEEPAQEPEHVRAAIRRCHAAWQRAYKEEMNKSEGNDGDDVFAIFYGGKAYRRAMPIVSTYESIQSYIACATHGLLIGAISPEEIRHILHAAQVALGALHCGPKQRR